MSFITLLEAKTDFLALLGASGLGILIVFAVLVVIMAAVGILSIIARSKKKKEDEVFESTVRPLHAVAPCRTVQSANAAPGSCGGIVLNGVDEPTAAMLMAIVADSLKKPLNELRFVSVRQINE